MADYEMEKDGKEYNIKPIQGEVGQDYLDFMKQFYSGRFGSSSMPMYAMPFGHSMPSTPPVMYGHNAPMSSLEYSALSEPGDMNEKKDYSPAMSMTVYHIEVKGDNYSAKE